MRKIALIVAGLIVLLIVVIVVLPRAVGLNGFKPQIADAVREATGRELHIGGDIDLAILPGLTLRVNDVALSNPDWAESPNLMTLGRLDLDVSLLPLLGGTLEVKRLVISDPALFLEQDAEGQASWDMAGGAEAPRQAGGVAPSKDEGGAPFSDIHLGEVRLENGSLSYVNRASGQEVTATPINVTVALPNIDSVLTLTGKLTVNGEPVNLDLSVDTPGRAMRQEPFAVAAKLGSALITAGYDGRVQQKPVPGLDGRFDLDIGSVGQLAAWLDQPLAEGQPDPGPLKLSAVFTADGKTAVLQQATIDGEALQATATGRIDASGEITKLKLAVESGVLDIDRYLPPPAPAAAEGATGGRKEGAPAERAERPRDLLAGLSDEPLDLSALRQTEADVTVTLAGIKAGGYEVGRLAFASTLQNGLLIADLQELALYGGRVTGRLGLDASAETLAADVALDVDKVDVGAMARVASPEEPPVGGVASAKLKATAEGASPRALAASLQGRLAVDLGGLQSAQTAAVSGLKLEAVLPGLEAAPSVTADLVYNKEPVNLQLGLAPLPEMLGGDPFPLNLKVASALINVAYDGKLQQQPVPGLDGRLDLDVGSVGKLAAWLGQPLPAEQPDPGPLKLAATFAADGAKVGLSEATIEGKAVKAKAEGSFDGSGDVAQFQARLTIDELNADAYLPPPAEQETAGAPAPEGQPAPTAEGWSEEPIELAPLQLAQGDVQITTGPVTYRGLVIEKSSATATLQGGVLNFDLTELSLAQGAVAAKATLDGSGPAAALSYEASVDGVQAKPLLSAFSGIDWLSGTMVFNAKGSASGRSQKELVGALNGDGAFKFLDGAIEGVNVAKTLRQAGTLGMGSDTGEAPKTDFSELSGSFVITDGVLDNQDLKMLAPLMRLSGAGQVPLPDRSIDYLAEAKLVGSLEGQGGQEALAGLPIPIRVEGPWSDVSYNIDWESVFQQAATDPKRLMQMPDSLKEAAKGFGVDLPVPGGEGLGDVLKSVPQGIPGLSSPGQEEQEGSGGTQGAIEGLKQLIPGGETSEPAPEEQPEQPKAEKPLDTMKGLFGN